MEYGKEVTCYDNKGREDELAIGARYRVVSYNSEHDAYYLEGVKEKCARCRFENE